MGSMSITRSLLAALLLLAGYSVSAQELTLPEAPSHKFLDRQNKVAFASLGALVAKDGFLPRQLTYRGSRLVYSRLTVPLVPRTDTSLTIEIRSSGDTHEDQCVGKYAEEKKTTGHVLDSKALSN